jgi:hypothetical protein
VQSETQQQDMLIAENNAADVRLLHAFLTYGKLPWRLYRVHDGEAALAFLQ